MKKTFTKLIAACALLFSLCIPLGMWGQTYTEVVQFESSVVVTTQNYKAYSNDDWNLSFGGNNISVGTNSKNANNCRITSSYGTDANTNNVAASVLSQSTISNISKITFTYSDIASGTSGAIYLAYTTDNGTTWSPIGLTSGTQGSSATQNMTFLFNKIASAKYAIILDKGSSVSANWRWDNVKITFYKEENTGPIQLTAPTNFSATAGNGEAEFSWDAVTNANGYTISYIPAGGSEATTTINNGSTTSTTITGLTNSTAYTCKIKAIGDGTNYSDSEYSDEISVTPTAAQQYTVTIADGITGGTVGANPTTATAGTTIHVTANPDGGYYLSALSYTDGQTSTDINQTTLQFEMPANDITINATFTAYTVTLNAGNGTVNNAETFDWNVSLNSGNLPAAEAPCNTWSFGGWSTTGVASQTTTAPTYVATHYVPTEDIVLYAVYTKTESGASFDGTTGGNFLIYADVSGTNYYAHGTGQKINSTTTLSEATTYTFEKPSGYASNEFAIKTGSDYITYSSSTNLGTSANPYKWTITYGTLGTWRLTSETSGRGFIYRAGTTNKFGGYSTSNVTANGTEYYDLEIGGAVIS